MFLMDGMYVLNQSYLLDKEHSQYKKKRTRVWPGMVRYRIVLYTKWNQKREITRKPYQS